MMEKRKRAQRARDFAAFQVNEQLMKSAPSDAIVLHCLPARRGEEATDGVLDGPNSRIIEQAANRMHVQKAVIAWLMGVKDL